VAAWQATMARLDVEECLAPEPAEPRRLSPPEIVDYLRSLPRLWTDSGPEGRQALAAAIFKRTDVLGLRRSSTSRAPPRERHNAVVPRCRGLGVEQFVTPLLVGYQ
jgi:hypothetical protein